MADSLDLKGKAVGAFAAPVSQTQQQQIPRSAIEQQQRQQQMQQGDHDALHREMNFD